jgi:hypothetical protein
MRYLILTYYKKPSGQIDEVMAVADQEINLSATLIELSQINA